MVEIAIVSRENIQRAWPDVVGYVEKALARQKPRLIDADYLYSLCRDGESMLLVVMNDNKAIGFAIVKSEFWPLAKVAFILATGGENGELWLQEMRCSIEQIASLNQCKYVIGDGRKGWAKIMPKYSIGHAPFFYEVS